MTVNAEDPAPPTLQHPRLEVRRILGAGGMGVVHAAYDPLLEREVAVKVIRVTGAASGARARILREARAIARISHPNVVHVYSADAFDDQVAIVMELVQGQTLRQWLAETKRSWQDIVAVFVEAGRGLAAAHDAGLVHRDFKPDNVMVRADGRVCVLDFGLARALETQAADGSTVPLTPDVARTLSAETTATLEASTPVDHASPIDGSRVTATGALVGTPLYMAPEQHLGAPTDARADQFAFCVALYRALFGHHPFDDETYATLVRSVVNSAYRIPTSTKVPQHVLAAIRRGLSVDPNQRFLGMRALLDATARDIKGLQRRRWAGIGGALVIGLLAAGIVADTSQSESGPPMGVVKPLPTVPRRITTTGDVRWVKPSHDGRHLILGNPNGEFLFRDVTGKEPDRDFRVALQTASCDISWSWSNDALAVSDGARLSQIYRIGSEKTPIDVPFPGCVVFTGESEVVVHSASHEPLRFWDLAKRSSRTCPVPGDDAWVVGIDARPDIERLLVTTLDDRTSRQHIWSMKKDCSDVRMAASIPHPAVDELRPVGVATFGRWGRRPDEIVAAMPTYSPAGAHLISFSMHMPAIASIALTMPSISYFSITRTGTLYATQHHQSTQVWMKAHAGPFRQLVKGSAGRALGSLTPDGGGIYFVEEGAAGRKIRTMSFDGQEPITVSEHNDSGIIPMQVVASRSGTLAVRGVSDHRHTVSLQKPGGPLVPIDLAADLGATDMEWVGNRLLLSIPGNRNFAVLEEGRRRSRDLLGNASLGWAFYPVGAPDGDSVALYLNRGGMALWTVRASTGEETMLGAKLLPIGWSADSTWIFALDLGNASADLRVVRVPAEGGPPQPWLELPGFSRSYQAMATTTGDIVVLYRTTQLDAYVTALPQLLGH